MLSQLRERQAVHHVCRAGLQPARRACAGWISAHDHRRGRDDLLHDRRRHRPAAIGGSVNPAAAVNVYGGPFPIATTTTVKARLQTTTGQWSGLVEATFDVMSLPGDYSGDGAVDSADFVVWRKSLGQSATLPNDTTPGIVTTADYEVWRANFGRSATPAGHAAALPEPATPQSDVVLPRDEPEPLAIGLAFAESRHTRSPSANAGAVFSRAYQSLALTTGYSERFLARPGTRLLAHIAFKARLVIKA